VREINWLGGVDSIKSILKLIRLRSPYYDRTGINSFEEWTLQ
jgi:hypothetical protein